MSSSVQSEQQKLMESSKEYDDNEFERVQKAIKTYEETRKRRRDDMYTVDDSSDFDDMSSITSEPTVKKEKSDKQSKRRQDIWAEDESGLYGLKPEYLRILGVTPPLDRWVYVSNFRCDKSDLRDVLELAGHVIVCSVVAIRERYATVMYSHPLEAVQAISLLNKQKFYGQRLSIKMIKVPSDNIILPKGLVDIGPGFGTNGKPLRDVVWQYERFANDKKSSIDTGLFFKPGSTPHFTEKDFETPPKHENLDKESHVNSWLDDYKNTRKFKIKNVEDMGGVSTDDDSDSDTKIDKDVNKMKRETEETVSNSSKGSTQRPNMPVSNLIPVVSQRPTGYRCPEPQSVQRLPLPTPTGPPGSGPRFGSFAPNNPRGLLPHPSAPMANMYPNSVNGAMAPRPVPAPNYPTGTAPLLNTPVGHMRPTGPSGSTVLGNAPRPGFSGPLLNNPVPGSNLPVASSNIPPLMQTSIPNQGSTTLEFRNLPPSTTFPVLCEKMSQVGQVLSVQLTTPGCAIVKYAHPSHAERSFLHFNGSCVEGRMIEARFI